MTFDEAVKLKTESPAKFSEGGITYYVFVTPDSYEDLMNYFTDIRGFFRHLTDKDAIKYSKNGQFSLHGLCYDKPNILYKRL